MPAYLLRRFSYPATLHAIAPARLLTFLRPFRDFLIGRGLVWDDPDQIENLDYVQLVAILMAPDGQTPTDLIDALYFVDDLATAEGMDQLLVAAREGGLTLDLTPDQSPADLAVQVWLLDPDLLARQHAEQFLFKPRSFESYQMARLPAPEFCMPTPAQLRDLERSLNAWFEQRNRGYGARVFIFPRPDGVWFQARHGEPFKREESLEGDETGSVCYRPVKYDVLVYHEASGELRINAQTPGERQLYRAQFGRHLFGDAQAFPGIGKYTLQPLQDLGEAALACRDVPGLEWVRLKEVHYFWGGPANEFEIRKADNVFAALAARGLSLPETARLVRAVFQVKFAYAKSPRAVTIRPSNIAQFTRDADAPVVEDWLRRRGFILPPGEGQP